MQRHRLALQTLAAWATVDLLCAVFEPIGEIRSAVKLVLFLPLLALSLPSVVTRHPFGLILIISAATSAFVAFPGSINLTFALRNAAFTMFALVVFEALRPAPINLVMRYVSIYVGLISLGAIVSLHSGRPSVYETEIGFGGISGGFASGNELSYLLAFLLATLVAYCYLRRDAPSAFSYILIVILSANAFLLTTKSAVLFALLSFALLVPRLGRWHLIFLGGVFITGMMRFDFSMLEDVAAVSRFAFFSDRFDLLWALTSGRSERLAAFDFTLSHLFFPLENTTYNFEMDFFDATINLGVIGILIVVGTTVFAVRYSSGHIATLILTGAAISIAFFAGHLLTAVAVAPYAALYLAVASRFSSRYGRLRIPLVSAPARSSHKPRGPLPQ